MASLLRKSGTLFRTFISSKLYFRQTFDRLISRTSVKLVDINCDGEITGAKGLVLGVYVDDSKDPEEVKLSPTANRYNEAVCGRLWELLKISGPAPKLGRSKIFYGLDHNFTAVALVGVGKDCQGYNDIEDLDEGKEAIRIASGVGSRALQGINMERISVESFGHSESAAEGALLGIWLYQEHREKQNQVYIPQLALYDDCDIVGWQIGLHKAAAQNLARQFSEMPPNLLTPTLFAQNTVEIMTKSGVNVEVKVVGWAASRKMGLFLGAAKGSCEPPIFLELSYYGTCHEERPIVLVGSGVTFDSGGLCLKPPHVQQLMRGDMSGAACCVATIRAIAELRLPMNIRALIPLIENMPGCLAIKPGDTLTAMNGKSVRVQNTNHEGRLILADALYYAQSFWPKFVLDVGTLTREVRSALSTAATGVFTNSDPLWEQIKMAGVHTGDRMWRMPLWHHYTKQVLRTSSCDVKTKGEAHGGGACRAAAFLREFVPCGEWLHLDSYGVFYENGIENPYLRAGMSGRPTRTMIELISQLYCKECS